MRMSASPDPITKGCENSLFKMAVLVEAGMVDLPTRPLSHGFVGYFPGMYQNAGPFATGKKAKAIRKALNG